MPGAQMKTQEDLQTTWLSSLPEHHQRSQPLDG